MLTICSMMIVAATVAARHAPVIDVHLHAETLTSDIAASPDKRWFPEGLKRPPSDEALRDESFEQLRQYNVVKAVTSDVIENVRAWRAVDPERIVPALMGRGLTDQARERMSGFVKSGEIQVLGEMTWQYAGYSPSDPTLEPFWKMAEELDVPVAVHMGLTPAGWSQTDNDRIRVRYGSPLLLEDVLVRHPRARVYVMHAGYPLLDEMLAMLQAYPNLYVDVAWIDWYIPKVEFLNYLKRIVEAGYASRVMYGSDQMQWPEAIGRSIDAIDSAKFLSDSQRRDILCRNAVRFFRWERSLCE